MNARVPKTALVTGGAKRIGRAIVEDLHAHGFAVAIHANDSLEEARELALELSSRGPTCIAVEADLAKVKTVPQMVAKAVDGLGPIGLLVNNASVFEDDDARRYDEANFDLHFSVHLKAPLMLAEAFLDHLPETSEGLIVNVIDQRVWALTPRFFTYTLSKSALWTATRTMAQAFAPHGVRVNAIGPGPTLANSRQEEDDFRRQTENLPLKRGPELSEFGRTIRYLLEARSVTGQMIALDGGQHLAWETPDVLDIAE
jgi:NAD(P)-dependent dehydrogenase (short-subunit alcohol dehydrogenase family)